MSNLKNITKQNGFSVVIPTMWGSNFLINMLDEYEKCDLVKEVILIDNNPNLKPELDSFNKVIYYTDNKNIYVNPAWNIGYTLSSYNLILANDDIFINNISEVLEIISKSDFDIIGVDWKKSNILTIDEISDFGVDGYGCFMYIKNYISIPNQYKIWRGDYIQFDHNKKRGSLKNPGLSGDISKTVNSDKNLQGIAKNDYLTYNKLSKQESKKVLFVLVNYGTEQIDYLRTVVMTIKSFKKYKTTIIVNSNINFKIDGVDKVNVFDNMENYQLLPLTCRRTIYENIENFDLFVYGENDHKFEEHHLDKHIEYSELLPKNRISGLIQYELGDDGERHYPGYFKKYEWDFNSVESYNGKKFAHFSNVHQATFILTKKQLDYITTIHDFTKFFGESAYSVKCKVNTDIYDFCNMKKLICISDFKDNLIHHLPNLYIKGELGRNKNQSSDNNRMSKSIKKLLEVKKETNNPFGVNPILTIIIPTFNNVDFIQDCLSSVINSVKLLDCEIFVGIDSCGKTIEFIKNKTFDSRIRFFYFQKNLGPYIIKNTLATISNSDIILFFDSDDIMKENMIPEIISLNEKCDFVRPRYVNYNNSDGYSKVTHMTTQSTLFGEGVFSIKKELFLSMNGFEGWRTTADTDFINRLHKNSRKSNKTHQIVFYRRVHQDSLTQSKQTGYGSKIRSNYNNIIRNKKTFGPLPILQTSTFDEIFVDSIKPIEVFDEIKHKKMVVNEVVKNILNKTELDKTNVNYDLINKVIQQKGVYVPINNVKPIRENKPVDRMKITELKKDSLAYQSREFGDIKKHKKNSSPNIFGGNNKRKGGPLL